MSRLLVAQRALTVPGWAKDALWRNARAVPSLDLRFADNKSLVDAVTGASLITFTRASSGTYVDSAGVLQTAATDEPRFDHNPSTGESLGLLVEEQRTNLLLNSATLSTQSVTVAAAANTLSFYGTGTVTLTGVSTAGPLVGTGANNRVSLTFTPTVGVLILTVSGSVTNAQLEAGAFPTSYIPTTTETVTRAADVASIAGSNFSSWYNQTEGTVFVELTDSNSSGSRYPYAISDNTVNNRFTLFRTGATSLAYRIVSAGTQTNPGNQTVSLVASIKSALTTKVATDGAIAVLNGALSTPASPTLMPAVDRMYIGAGQSGAEQLSGTIKRITYWPVRLQNNTLQALTQP